MRRARQFPYKDWVFRSNYELQQAKRLEANDINFEYETKNMHYQQKIGSGICHECGGKDVYKKRVYTPDFYLVDTGIFVETKGRLDVETRSKMKDIIEQSDSDIRMVFMRDNYLTRKKKMLYSRWCELNGIQFAIGSIPLEWCTK